MNALGVHSEIGALHGAIVCRPSLAHRRLTARNCRDLFFEDVIWVREAEKDHDDLTQKMRERGVQVLELQDLLAAILDNAQARHFLLDRLVGANAVGPGIALEIRPWLDEMPALDLARHLIGGIAPADLPDPSALRLMNQSIGEIEFVLPPLPNTLFQRDPSTWIYAGVVCNPSHLSARQPEAIIHRAIYRFHPLFAGRNFDRWWGDADENFGNASIDGADLMPIGKGAVLMGLGKGTSAQATSHLARELFRRRAASRILACLLPNGAMSPRLSDVLAFVDHDLITADHDLADKVRCVSLNPTGDDGGYETRSEKRPLLDLVRETLGLAQLRVIATGGNRADPNCDQWDDGNGIVALAPGVALASERNARTIGLLQKAGAEIVAFRGVELGRLQRGARAMICPIARDPAY